MRSIEQLIELMTDCYDTDNLELARSNFQSQLTDEEIQLLRDRQEERVNAYANVNKERELELISEGEFYKRMDALDKKYSKGI